MIAKMPNGKNFTVHFRIESKGIPATMLKRYAERPPLEPGGGSVYLNRRVVFCSIHEGACLDRRKCNIATNLVGIAICNPLDDQFNRFIGRKLAFTRAIARLPREDRSAFWAAFFAKPTPPKPPVAKELVKEVA